MSRLDSFCYVFDPIRFVMYLTLYPVSYIALMRIFPANTKIKFPAISFALIDLCIKIDFPPITWLCCLLLSDIGESLEGLTSRFKTEFMGPKHK